VNMTTKFMARKRLEVFYWVSDCYVRFQVLTASIMKIEPSGILRRVSFSISLMMETVRTYETSVYYNETTRSSILEGSNLQPTYFLKNNSALRS
jgi:hypothetical protein